MKFSADFVARRNGFRLAFAADVARGETIAVVGESGAGKTTALRCIAGLLSPASGRIALGDETWFDASSRRNIAPHARNIGMVFQHGALFRRMSVLENAAFGLRAIGLRLSEALRRAREALATVDATHLERRRASDLSGGEGQRVALARAIALHPAVLLLDEPLTGLDIRAREPVRESLRNSIRAAQAATILVTHEPAEAMIFAQRFVVLEGGRMIQAGDLAALRQHPASPYVASFFSG